MKSNLNLLVQKHWRVSLLKALGGRFRAAKWKGDEIYEAVIASLVSIHPDVKILMTLCMPEVSF
jgi:hypothetical protein